MYNNIILIFSINIASLKEREIGENLDEVMNNYL